jgi:hypothetical protein
VTARVSVDPKGVFINAPFDSAYEPLFVTLVGGVFFLQYTPHCVLEVRERGEGRLRRIYDLMSACRTSVHDMSRISAPVRFNMPFELGLACALNLANPRLHDVLVFDAKPYRMDRTLSDYKGRDAFIHRGTCEGMIGALLDAFESSHVGASALRRATRELRDLAALLKRDHRAKTIFHPHLFDRLIGGAGDIARKHGLLAP